MPAQDSGARRKSSRAPAQGKAGAAGPVLAVQGEDWQEGRGLGAPERTGFWANVYGTCGVLAIIGTTPFIAVIVWHMFVNLDGSLASIVAAFQKDGLSLIAKIWPWTSKRAWQLLGSYAAFEALLQVYMPGKRFEANPTATRSGVQGQRRPVPRRHGDRLLPLLAPRLDHPARGVLALRRDARGYVLTRDRLLRFPARQGPRRAHRRGRDSSAATSCTISGGAWSSIRRSAR